MLLSLCFLSLLSLSLVNSQATKDVIMSSITVKNLHTTVGDPSITIQCFMSVSRATTWIPACPPLSMKQVKATDTWYLVESQLFNWDPAAIGSSIFCQVYEQGVVTKTTLGETDDIAFADIVYSGSRKDTTVSATDATFYLRCGNCPPPNPSPIGSLQTKTIFVKSIQVSDTMDSVLSDPDIYMNCNVAGTGTTYARELPTVNHAKQEYTIEQPLSDFVWTVGFTDSNGTAAVLSGSMPHSGACGIFEHDTTDPDDSLGTVIIHFTDITTDGAKYTIPNDPDSWIVLYDCSDPSVCNLATSLMGFGPLMLLALLAALL